MSICVFFVPFAFSQEIELEEITIKRVFLEISTEGIDYFSSERIKDFPSFSLEEIVDYSSSIDLRKRFTFGIQQDISLRGSIFEDSFINLNGIKINDPQTGHFNLELPLTSEDLEEIEIFKNSQKINFILKKPKEKGFLLKSSFGQHALWEKLISFNFPLKQIKNRISLEHKISSGARQDTDFEIYNSSFHSLWEKDNKEIEFLFGHTKRDFGADSFYSVKYPQQGEHADQRFFSLRAKFDNLNNTLYFRRHADKYILNRHNPSYYTNYHTTYIYGTKFEFDFYNDYFLSVDLGREKITSTKLDNHRRLRKGLSWGVKDRRIKDFIFDLFSGFDYYENWEYLENLHLGVGYFLKDNLKLRYSFDRIWRAPSFTELYYSDPSNIGNPNLGIQKSNNFEWGLDYFSDKLNLNFCFFLRDQLDTIDWVKNLPFDPWQAENIGDLNVYGFDFYSEIDFKNNYLKKVSLGYTYQNLDRKNPYSFSKYVFDYNCHKVVSNFEFNFKGISLNLIANFSKPIDRKEYLTFDLKIGKRISDFELFLEGINILNQDYEELKDIRGSPRWFKISFIYSF
ncbi:MAG: TonB-dependent receptor [Candidatus Omnitrophica bacterium]|nr:TonB-dependent receptor [Candidatus Omnitrophota bacterium]MCM8826995.1 TonB-dependent receptor [Candidatus Omnitrophota bacterium]